MKPDVIKQTKEIEEDRAKMAQEQMKQMHNTTMTSIVMSKDGQPPRQLSQQDVLDIINGQRESIQQLLTQNEELQKIAIQLQQQMMQMQSGFQLPPPQSSNDEKYKQEINTLKNKIELLEKEVKDKNSIETPNQDVIEIDMSRPKSEPEV
jgi:thiamine kinase-like enzyme